ncbi:MAG: Holliday junction resolvase [Methanobacteriota archaeon]
MSSQYERELKSILEGNNSSLLKATKTCSAIEKEKYYSILKKPFIVVRGAGSLGVDLVALRGDISFLLEIKASIEDTLHFSSVSGKLQVQAESMRTACEKTGTLPIYAYRLKNYRGDSWRLFTMDVSGLEGRIQVLHKRLPRLSLSKKGSYIMRWNDGLPLSDFIAYLCR